MLEVEQDLLGGGVPEQLLQQDHLRDWLSSE
jgi:hypothetical protein